MGIAWFGKKYAAPAYSDTPRIATPVGMKCCRCQETITAKDDGWRYANGPYAHRACYLRAVIGSVAHQQKRCGCFIKGSMAEDDPRLSKREAAEAAVAYMNTRMPTNPHRFFRFDRSR